MERLRLAGATNCFNVFPEFLSMVSMYNYNSFPPPILFFGDSVTLRVSTYDKDKRSLLEMVHDKLGERCTMSMVARSAYHSTVYQYFISALMHMRHRPKMVIIPINMRSFSPQWDRNPAWQFNEEINLLKDYVAGRTLNYTPAKSSELSNEELFRQGEAVYPYTDFSRIGQFLDIINTKDNLSTEAKIFRIKQIFIFHYLHHLIPNHRKLTSLIEAVKLLSNNNILTLCYITPVNYQGGNKYVGEEFSTALRKNTQTVIDALSELNSKSVIIRNYSTLLAADKFFTPDHQTEHLNQEGREEICTLICKDVEQVGAFQNARFYESINWTCPICGGDSFSNIREYRTKSASCGFLGKYLFVCAQCGAGSMFPFPEARELNDYYAGYWESDMVEGSKLLEIKQAESRVAFLRNRLEGFSELSILDIGAGLGVISEVVNRNFSNKTIYYDAVEVSNLALEYLNEHIKPRRIYSNYQESADKYSLIIMSHIIEHFADPVQVLSEQKVRMNKDSLLFVEVPNQDYKFKPSNEPHLISFTPQALATALQKAGYSVLKMESVGQPISSMLDVQLKCPPAKERTIILKIWTKSKTLLNRISKKVRGRLGLPDARAQEEANYYVYSYGPNRRWIRCIVQIADQD
jgi:2-polyprenyl-3-methyl-5-hydroxy-6-metoxy-1,4-benzoquinol methylase